jgi:hypothetical protein
MKYYVSLNDFLRGYYVQVLAENKTVARAWASKTLGKLWCSVYEPNEIENKSHFDKSKVIGPIVRLTVEEGELYDNY